jgi:DNA-binding CsgD family transcriptional regulator
LKAAQAAVPVAFWLVLGALIGAVWLTFCWLFYRQVSTTGAAVVTVTVLTVVAATALLLFPLLPWARGFVYQLAHLLLGTPNLTPTPGPAGVVRTLVWCVIQVGLGLLAGLITLTPVPYGVAALVSAFSAEDALAWIGWSVSRPAAIGLSVVFLALVIATPLALNQVGRGLRHLAARILTGQPVAAPASTVDRPEVASNLDSAGLTDREREILELLTQGKTNRQIAGELFVTTETVKFHVSNILTKLAVDNRTQAAALAARAGYGVSSLHNS